MTSTSNDVVNRATDNLTPPRDLSPAPSSSVPKTADDLTASHTGQNGMEAGQEEVKVLRQDDQDNAPGSVPPKPCAEAAVDEFGLPTRVRARPVRSASADSGDQDVFHEVEERRGAPSSLKQPNLQKQQDCAASGENGGSSGQESASMRRPEDEQKAAAEGKLLEANHDEADIGGRVTTDEKNHPIARDGHSDASNEVVGASASREIHENSQDRSAMQVHTNDQELPHREQPSHSRQKSTASEWSHQRLMSNAHDDEEEAEEDAEDWKDMPALGEMDVYDDFGHLVARGVKTDDDEAVYRGLGGAGKGYTRVQLDEDAQSATSLDEDTKYLFRDANNNSAGVDDDELRDPLSQLQATKDLLTESQRIAYVGVTRLAIYLMILELESMPSTKWSQKTTQHAGESMKKWSQAIMARLYSHMEIDPAEQIMIEQLAEHGVQPADLVRPLMQNARVDNPLAKEANPPKDASSTIANTASSLPSRSSTFRDQLNESDVPPPPYEAHDTNDLPNVRTPSQLPSSQTIDIDIRWTVLCDLFLVLIADSVYDARSRTLLERVGEAMEVPWLQICRFEKRVIDALEMQEDGEKETWDESKHMERRRKLALKQRYMVMGLATVGGGLVIGLSAGLLAPVIGAGLAAGFTTIGISGTGAFLGGAGGTALIATGATLTGSNIGLKASGRRTGAVQTFEYRPLHNNKRVNLIVTVSGWMTGKVDDVRLPFSTVDPIMGDLYSVLWEPKMLQSTGDTINILATEALTQGLQQVLGSTILTALMASVQLPIILTKLSYLIDNPWNVSLARANAAGLILADSIIDNNLGKRPITLIGFSLGSRLIFSCLKELANKGAFGLVQNVYLFGSPVVANKDEYLKARSVVSGRFVNGYSSNDWILGYLFRATSGGIMRVAGIAPVEGIPRLENIDCTHLVNGHMEYRAAMPRLLREVGWEVTSDEFAEIEDADPDNHAERQRELIREIDEARKEAELKPEKKRFGLFKRGKLAQKKGWETYDVDHNQGQPSSPSSSDHGGSVLFDIDAIRAELAAELIEVRQLESTLPPMKLELNSAGSSSPAIPSPSDSQVRLSQSQRTEKRPLTPRLGTNASTSPGRAYSHHNDSHASPGRDDDVHLTFDSTFYTPPRRTYSSSFHKESENSSDLRQERPGLRSAATMPAFAGSNSSALGLDHNAWAEHDFHEGGEGEIHMTFE